MSGALSSEAILESLKKRGRPLTSQHWWEGEPDYVAEYSLDLPRIVVPGAMRVRVG